MRNTLRCHVIAFEYPGYGLWKHTTEAGEEALNAAADEVWSVVTRSLGVDPKDVILFGRSLGAAVACALAARHPDAGGLVMLSPFASIREVAKQASHRTLSGTPSLLEACVS